MGGRWQIIALVCLKAAAKCTDRLHHRRRNWSDPIFHMSANTRRPPPISPVHFPPVAEPLHRDQTPTHDTEAADAPPKFEFDQTIGS